MKQLAERLNKMFTPAAPTARQVAAWAKAHGLRKQPGTLNGLTYFRAANGALLTAGAVRDLMVGA